MNKKEKIYEFCKTTMYQGFKVCYNYVKCLKLKKRTIVYGMLIIIVVGVVYAFASYNMIVNNIKGYINSGDYTKAETLIKEELKINYQMEDLYIIYSELYLRQNKIIEAINILEDGINKTTNHMKLDNEIIEIKKDYSEYFKQVENSKAEADAQKKADEQVKKEEQIRIDAENQKKENITNTLYTLFATTKQVITNRLKAPSEAKFDAQPQLAYDESEGIYKIKSYVDAQNSFGAMLRSEFYAEYNNNLEIIYLVFDNEVLVDTK